MGACYGVILKIKLKAKQGAIAALNEHIRNDISTNYSLERYAQQGITTETFDNLMRIFLAGWKGQEVKISKTKDFDTYENSFNASYGWESGLLEMFETLSLYLEDGSTILIYVENDYDELVAKNGKCEQVH